MDFLQNIYKARLINFEKRESAILNNYKTASPEGKDNNLISEAARELTSQQQDEVCGAVFVLDLYFASRNLNERIGDGVTIKISNLEHLVPATLLEMQQNLERTQQEIRSLK